MNTALGNANPAFPALPGGAWSALQGCTFNGCVVVPIAGVVQGVPGTPIGEITATSAGAGIQGEFVLDPVRRFLDDWYDFRWINVVTSYLVNGAPVDADMDGNPDDPVVGELPAIDPQVGQNVPGALPGGVGDGQPFYFNTLNWVLNIPPGIHNEGVGSTFVDARFDNPGPGNTSILQFETYLVAQNLTDPAGWPPNQFCVLGGFSWRYQSATNSVLLGGPLAANAALINAALANANPPFAGGPWAAIAACAFNACTPIGPDLSESQFRRGDSNGDSVVDLSDVIEIIDQLFPSSPPSPPKCADAYDANDDGAINLADALSLLSYLFAGGAAPPEPFRSWEGDPTSDTLGCKSEIQVPPIIDAVVYLTNDFTWRLVGQTRVVAGGTLVIEPGTTIVGDSATSAHLIVERDGTLIAEGLPTAPIVFTSQNPVGLRAPGDWGGVVILGRAVNNTVTGENLTEGVIPPAIWGDLPAQQDPTYGFGSLRYVRIEWCGSVLSPNVGLPALGLYATGSSSVVESVQLKSSAGDGLEVFGGATNVRRLLCSGVLDDALDFSFGYRGKLQFVVAHSFEPGDRAFEVDNHEFDFGLSPATRFLASNLTLLSPLNNDTAIQLRRGGGGGVFNSLVQGWDDAGLDIDDFASTQNHVPGVETFVQTTTFSMNFEDCELGDVETPSAGFLYSSCEILSDIGNLLGLTDPLLQDSTTLGGLPGDPILITQRPNYRPTPAAEGGATPTAIDPPGVDPFFEVAPYRGAVPPASAGPDWTDAPWVSFWLN
ncbi:MAG: dockerin type I domain-containing protein [Planctomycetota bacterium]